MSLRDFIINELFDKTGKLSNKAETKCKNKYPDMHEQIMGEWSEYELFTDKCHAIIHGKAKACKICGGYISYGWRTANYIYCSKECRSSDSSTIYQKTVQTHIEKYGDNYKEVIREKVKQTCLDRYGVDNPMKSEEVKNRYQSPFVRADVREKIKKTLIEKYGVDNPMKTDDVRAKAVATTQARYDTPIYTQSDEYKKRVEVKRRKYVELLGLEYLDNLLIGPTKYGMVSKECIKAQMIVSEFGDYHNAMHKMGIEADGNITTPHQILIGWLNELGIEFTVNDRQTIKPKELDIFIPTHSLAIEVNGLYWHSAVTTDSQHIDKFNQCRLLGIKLLQFTDRDIIERPELIKSMILSKLGLLPNKIMARKCGIVDIGSNDAQKLLDQWHYQSRTTNAANFKGLMYNNRIVAIIGYTLNGTECRIERFACELFTNVVGGYSKLEKFIIKQHSPERIVTFSLGLISDGSVYAKNGYTTPGYSTKPEWYVTDYKTLYNRQRFMKHKLPSLFGEGFDPNKTERENILLNGFRLYFGAGITKWIKDF